MNRFPKSDKSNNIGLQHDLQGRKMASRFIDNSKQRYIRTFFIHICILWDFT